MARAPTLKDVAQKLDLSISTITRALADDRQISERTKARVRLAADEMGYVAHSGARAVRNGKSTLIGLVIPDVQNPFYGAVAKALAQCFDAAGYQLILAITEDDAESEERQIRAFLEARVSGLVIVPTANPTRKTMALIGRTRSCIQLIRRLADLNIPWFGIDEHAAIREATSYLYALGHRSIALIEADLDTSTSQSRIAGYRCALKEHGIAPESAMIKLGPTRSEHGASAFEELWNSQSPPTAIITGGARLTVGLLRGIDNAGVQVPRDLSIIGYGDLSWLPMSLTSIALPIREIALSCGDCLLRRIRSVGGADDDGWNGQHIVTHAAPLVIAKSTGSPPTNRR